MNIDIREERRNEIKINYAEMSNWAYWRRYSHTVRYSKLVKSVVEE
jgi:hypothetical protein